MAITQILKGFRGMLLTRAQIRFYWVSVVWGFLLLLIFTQGWWAMFGLRHMRHWTFPNFSIIVLQTIVSYMLAALVFPDFFGEKIVDLRAHYYRHTRWFYGLMIGLLFVSLTKGIAVEGHLPEMADTAFHIVFVLVSLGAAMTQRRWYHEFVTGASVVLVGAYVFLLFFDLD